MQVLKFGEAGATGPVMVFLHGFPGIRSKQNRDFAEKAATQLSGRAFVPLYGGMGAAPGTFSFSSCLGEVRAFFKELLASETDRQVNLVGHSWGGLLSLILASENPERVARVVLLSPLLDFKAMGNIREGFAQERLTYPGLSFGSVDELGDDFDAIGASLDVPRIISLIPKSTGVLLLQAKDDLITPTAIAEKLVPNFQARPELKIVDVNHSFIGPAREEVGDLIVAHFNDSTSLDEPITRSARG